MTSTATMTINGDNNWWSETIRALSLSHEKSATGSGTTSFLSCVLIDSSEDGVVLSGESAMSTTAITVTEDSPVSVEGYGKFLIPIPMLRQYLSSMPAGMVVMSIHEEEKKVILTDDNGEVEFILGTVDIISEDMTPTATHTKPRKSEFVTVNGADLVSTYQSSSTMALSVEKDPLAGQDPRAGCYITVKPDGIQMFSMAASAAEGFLPVESDIKKESTIITAPNSTLPRLGVFSDSEEVDIAVIKDTLHLTNGEAYMVITSMNIGARKKNVASVDMIIKVLSPVWEAGVVDVTVNPRDFLSALSRAESTGSDNVHVQVTDTSLTLSVSDADVPFRQKVSCSTQWHDDDHWIESSFHIGSVKDLSNTLSRREELNFRIGVKPDGNPWALLITTSDFDQSTPHNFHMVNLKTV